MIGAVALVLAQAAPSPPAAVTVAVGGITPRVVCASDPRFSYALYLPKDYAPGRSWPILYIYDPRGRGAFAAELFAEAAAAHGLLSAAGWPMRPARSHGPLPFSGRRARAGNRKAALDALRAATARGLRLPRKRLADDPELAVLAGDPAFEEILRSLPAS